MHRLYTKLHKTILGFADIGSMKKKLKNSTVKEFHIKNDKTKKPMTPSFVLYIEYTFTHFGMSISCK
jgi:hypothetical protein